MGASVFFAFDVAFLAVTAAIAATIPLVIVASAVRQAPARFPIAEGLIWSTVVFGWFALALTLARPAAFDVAFPPQARALALPVLLFGGVLIGWALIAFLPSVRARVMATPLHWPIGIQTARVIGGAFLIYAAQGKADWTFALTAGLGDVLVGITAPIVATIVARGGPAARPAALAHTLLGLLDFTIAVSLGIALGKPLGWPAPMIPLFLVPLATLTHVWTLAALWRTRKR